MTFSPNLVISATKEQVRSKSETTPILRRRGESRRRAEKGAEDDQGSLPIVRRSTSPDEFKYNPGMNSQQQVFLEFQDSFKLFSHHQVLRVIHQFSDQS